MITRSAQVRAILAPSFIMIILLVAWAAHRPLLLVRSDVSAADADPSHRHVNLIRKDADFRPVANGAHGRVDYTPEGALFSFQLRADSLAPSLRYLIELDVDGTVYSIASHAADARGALALDTALSTFAEGACVGKNFDAPKAVAGHHTIKFWVKRDGNPASGTSRGTSPGAAGASLPCAGNGHGDYTYMLLEQQPAEFTGRP